MLSADRASSALASAAEVDEFILSEVHSERVRKHVSSRVEQQQIRARELWATVFVDHERGRGQSRLSLSENSALGDQISAAGAQANASLGPAWHFPPPAAPAKVTISDAGWQQAASEVVDHAYAALRSHLPGTVRLLDASLEFTRHDTRAILSNGFDNQYRGTSLSVHAILQARGGEPVPLRLRARQRSDLHWQAHIDRAHERSLAAARATPPTPGPCDVLILGSSYLPRSSSDFSFWTPLVAQASADLMRRGMARYQREQSILPREAVGEALTLRSDGTVDYGLRSAPFADDGQPVRRFTLVEDGRAAGTAIDHRDAALDAHTANGGVRNLIVEPGRSPLEDLRRPGARPLLIVHRLSEVQTHPRGRLLLQIESAEWRTLDAAGNLKTRTIRGGVLSGDLFEWLHHTFYANEVADYLWYRGPRAIRINQLRLH